MNFDYTRHTLAATVSGSRLYGTSTPESDLDVRGVIVPPMSYWLGMESFEQYEVPGEDTVFHELRKFLRLSAAGNPAFLEIWWAPFHRRPVWNVEWWWTKMKTDLWSHVLCKKLVKPHLGMARAHLARITQPGRNCGIKGRDAIEKFGYNTKDACHVIRVLYQARELLETGRLTFPRPEVDNLVEIKRGVRSLAYIEETEQLLTESVRRSEENSALPEGPNLDRVNSWLIENVPKILGDMA